MLFPDSPDIFRFPDQEESPFLDEVQPFSRGILTSIAPSPQISYFGSSLFSSSPPDSLSGNLHKVGNTCSDSSSPDTSPEKSLIKPRKYRPIDPKCCRRLFNSTEEDNLISPPSKILEWDDGAKLKKPEVVFSRPVNRRKSRNRKLKNKKKTPTPTPTQTDRLNVLSSLLEMSGRSVKKQFKCYLDLGCGNGEIFSTNMAFLDPRLGYCADLHNNHLPGFIKVVDNKIPLPDKSVDLITCHVAIHHFTHPELMISEMKRVIMPGGYLFIREHDVSPEEETDVTAYLDLLHMMELIRHRRPITKHIQNTFTRKYWSRVDMNGLLSNVGFEEIGFQSYVKHSNPQRIYHALYSFRPNANFNDKETTRISKTVQYSVGRNNLVIWLRTKAKKTYKLGRQWLDGYDRSYYRWFSDTIRKKLGLNSRKLEMIINQSLDDLDFFQQIFRIIHPNFDYSRQVDYTSAFSEKSDSTVKIIGRPRSRSSPDNNKNEKLIPTNKVPPKTRYRKSPSTELERKNKPRAEIKKSGGYRENKIDEDYGKWKTQSNRGSRGRQKRGYRRTRSHTQFGFHPRHSYNKNEYHSRYGH
uniref:SAM dependent methyltransferase n=1 Tax=Pithovirus LCPAC202 TaxID=2506592 RepID=A0A481Z5K7_9VIRU|nr:MAG: SAM dependent methyltransferase [Pithovirus LCPAC202]